MNNSLPFLLAAVTTASICDVGLEECLLCVLGGDKTGNKEMRNEKQKIGNEETRNRL